MKKKIERWTYKRVLDTDFEVDLPEEPEYYFQTGVRRAIAIIPQWTTWNKEHCNKEEELYEFEIICVYQSFECRIEKTRIQTNRIPELYNSDKDPWSLAKFLVDRGSYGKRTREQFLADYNSAIEEMNRQLKYNQPVATELVEDKGWECPNSPTGHCEYEQEDGTYDEDSCRHCGEPEERK